MDHIATIYCRFCAEPKSSLDVIDLSIQKETKTGIIRKLSLFTRQVVDLTDNSLPETVCNSCLYLLNDAHAFINKIELSQIYLRDVYLTDNNVQVIKQETSNNRKISVDIKLEPCADLSRETCASEENHSECSDIDDATFSNFTWKSYKWSCKFCGMRGDDMASVREHCKNVHETCFGLKCADCIKTFTNLKMFISHVQEHRQWLRYYCFHCDKKLEDSESKEHIKEHFKGLKKCEKCCETFTNNNDLLKHSIYKSNRRRSEIFEKAMKEELKCNICSKQCRSVHGYKTHMSTHNIRNRDYICDQCGKGFYTKEVLNGHIIIHQSPDPQVCEICKKTFLTLTRLKKHVRTHNNMKPYTCDVCLRLFRDKDHLKSHMKIHSQDTPFKCEHCGKGFKFRNGLKIHEAQHTGARPFKCENCGKEFANWSNCNKHMKRKHGTTLAKSVLTPHGRLPLNPKTLKPKEIHLNEAKEWTEKIMQPLKRTVFRKSNY